MVAVGAPALPTAGRPGRGLVVAGRLSAVVDAVNGLVALRPAFGEEGRLACPGAPRPPSTLAAPLDVAVATLVALRPRLVGRPIPGLASPEAVAVTMVLTGEALPPPIPVALPAEMVTVVARPVAATVVVGRLTGPIPGKDAGLAPRPDGRLAAVRLVVVVPGLGATVATEVVLTGLVVVRPGVLVPFVLPILEMLEAVPAAAVVALAVDVRPAIPVNPVAEVGPEVVVVLGLGDIVALPPTPPPVVMVVALGARPFLRLAQTA